MAEQVARVLGPSSLIEIAGRNVTSAQVAEARSIAEIVCVQNHYNVVHREDDALIDELKGMGVAYVPFFPLGGLARRCSPPPSRMWRGILGRRRCRRRWRGCFTDRPTFC